MEWFEPTLLILGLAVGAGAFVQSSIGFGTAVVAAPFVVVLRPDERSGWQESGLIDSLGETAHHRPVVTDRHRCRFALWQGFASFQIAL